jgi:hypothetical protein
MTDSRARTAEPVIRKSLRDRWAARTIPVFVKFAGND